MNKKAIAILAAIFLLIVGTLGFLIYSRSSPDTGEETPPLEENPVDEGNNPDEGDSGGEDEITPPVGSATSKFFKLTSSDQIVSPILFYNGNGVTYLNSLGELIKSDFETSANGQITLTRTRNLEIQKKAQIRRILWPKSGDDFIAEFSSSSGLGSSPDKSYSYFNFATGAYIDLPAQVTSVEWMPSGDKIIYIWTSEDSEGNLKSTLNIADPDTQNYSTIAELYEPDDTLSLSPDGLNLILHRTQNTEGINKILQTTPDGKVWKDLVKDGYNFGILWSPDSQKFLFGKKDRNGAGYRLWFYDLYSGEVKNLGLQTVPSKAVWSSDSRTVYLAAPKDNEYIQDYSDLEDTFTADGFYKIDTSSLEKTEYMPENMDIDGRELFLNPAEDKLFFKNAQDGGLYYLDLTK